MSGSGSRLRNRHVDPLWNSLQPVWLFQSQGLNLKVSMLLCLGPLDFGMTCLRRSGLQNQWHHLKLIFMWSCLLYIVMFLHGYCSHSPYLSLSSLTIFIHLFSMTAYLSHPSCGRFTCSPWPFAACNFKDFMPLSLLNFIKSIIKPRITIFLNLKSSLVFVWPQCLSLCCYFILVCQSTL